MRPLLWKELRDMRLWVGAAAVLVAALQVLNSTRGFRNSWEGGYLPVFLPFLAAIAAVGLGASQVACERNAGTLDYLRARPVSPAIIVWAKFAAGTVTLALVLTALVGFGFWNPQEGSDTALRAIREQVGFREMLLTLLPRWWCVYALALFVSVLVDRLLKALAFMTVVAITLLVVISFFGELAPLSGFVYWLPFMDGSGGLLVAAKDPALFWTTAIVYSAGALLLTALAAALLKRSPERYWGNAGLVVAAAGVIGVAVLSASAATMWLPEVRPSGVFEFQAETAEESLSLAASGSNVLVGSEHALRFVDFSQLARPRQIAETSLPLWTVRKLAMSGGTALVMGERKALPVDAMEIAMVRPGAPVATIPLGPARNDFISAPVSVGAFVYVGITHERECRIHVFDSSTLREIAAVTIDRLRPKAPDAGDGQPPLAICSRGAYLYIASPSALTTMDVRNPASPVVTSQLPFHPKESFLYGLRGSLAWQDDRLYETLMWPLSLGAYDLSDPANPVRQPELLWHGTMFNVAGAGSSLYEPWREGLMEFRAERGGLVARRYLNGGRGVGSRTIAGEMESRAITGAYVYVLTNGDEHNRRAVQVFQAAR